MGADLDYDVLFESIISDNEDKDRDNIIFNCLFNLQNLKTNIDILMCQ